jgi:hypothetical protein
MIMGEIPVTYEEGAALLKDMEALERPLSLYEVILKL